MELPARHCHFDDRRATDWYAALPAALAAAAAARKCVFLHISRRDCGGSRALVERVLPKEEIAEELNAGFVCLCCDQQALPPDIETLVAALPRREPTPLCLYLDGDGRLLHSTVGGRPPAVFLRDLTEAHAKAAARAR